MSDEGAGAGFEFVESHFVDPTRLDVCALGVAGCVWVHDTEHDADRAADDADDEQASGEGRRESADPDLHHGDHGRRSGMGVREVRAGGGSDSDHPGPTGPARVPGSEGREETGRRWYPVPSADGSIDIVPGPYLGADFPRGSVRDFGHDPVVASWTRPAGDEPAGWGQPSGGDEWSPSGDRPEQAPGQARPSGPPDVVFAYPGDWRPGPGGSWVYWSSTPGKPDVEYVWTSGEWRDRVIGWPGPVECHGTEGSGPPDWLRYATEWIDPKAGDGWDADGPGIGLRGPAAGVERDERTPGDRPSPAAGWGITGRIIRPGDITTERIGDSTFERAPWLPPYPGDEPGDWSELESLPYAFADGPGQPDPEAAWVEHGTGEQRGRAERYGIPWIEPGAWRSAFVGPPSVVAFRWRRVGPGWVRDVEWPVDAPAFLDLGDEQDPPAFVLGADRIWVVDPDGFQVSRVACPRCARRSSRVARWSTLGAEVTALVELGRVACRRGATGHVRGLAADLASSVCVDAVAAVWAEAQQDATAVRDAATEVRARARRATADALAALQESPDWAVHVWVERTTGRRLTRDQWHALTAWVTGHRARHDHPRWWGPFGHGDVEQAPGRDDPSKASQPDGPANHGDGAAGQAPGRRGDATGAGSTVPAASTAADWLDTARAVVAICRRRGRRAVRLGDGWLERGQRENDLTSTGGDEQGPGRRPPAGNGDDAADDAATRR